MKKQYDPIHILFWVFMAIFALGIFGTIVSEFQHECNTLCPLCGEPLVGDVTVAINGVEYHQGCINRKFAQDIAEAMKGSDTTCL